MIPTCHPNRRHYARGLCESCYQTWRYRNDPEYREKCKAMVKKSQHKKYKKDPDWNARKQRKWRKENPEEFNFLMARCYLKKLSPKSREKLIAEMKT
jgi:hypothetical protein